MKTVLEKKGLPANPNTEMLVLGFSMIEPEAAARLVESCSADDFVVMAHKTIFARVTELAQAGETIDRVTVANILLRYGELETIGGLSYLVSLDDGLPRIPDISAYVRIIKTLTQRRKLCYIGQEILNQAVLGEAEPSVIAREAQAKMYEATDTFGSSEIELIEKTITNWPGGASAFLDPSRWDKGIPSGFRDLDDLTDGFHKSEIFLIGARPSHGKSSIALQITKSVAETGRTVAFYSLEMTRKDCILRMACDAANISFARFRSSSLDQGGRMRMMRALQYVMELPIAFDDNSGITVQDIQAKTQRIANERPVALIVIDYAQLLRTKRRYGNDNEKFEGIGNDLQELSKATGVPVLLLSQLTRASAKKVTKDSDNKPQLSDCRGSGVWEQIANVGMLLYREWMQRRDRDDLRDVAELIVEKNRNGPIGVVNLTWQGWAMRFGNVARADDAAPTPEPSPQGSLIGTS